MKAKDLLGAFAVTVLGGLVVYAIRRKIEGDPVSMGGLIPSAADEAQGEVYA